MVKYIMKRVFAAIATLLLVIVITFLLMNTVPGGPFITEEISIEAAARLEAKYGLDKPLLVQLKNYVLGYVQGDLGVSLVMSKDSPVTELLFTQGRFATSAKLGVWTLIITLGVGIPLGCIAAYNRGKLVDNVLRVFSVAGSAIPGFVFATMCLMIFVVQLGWLKATSGKLETLDAYIMPLICMSLGSICSMARLMRTSMLDVINQDYIRTARAKGLSTNRVIFKHALRNSLIPVITNLGPMVANLLTGTLIVEKTFIIPGMGQYMVSSVGLRDYPVIMATTIIFSALLIFCNLLVDIGYTLADPRISFNAKGE